MSKVLENIINKAVKEGFANKNSRMSFGMGYVGKKTLEDFII